MRQAIEKALLWTSLRAMGNSAAARMTIIIPFVGYLILFNENALLYFELSRRIFGEQPTATVGAAHVSLRLLSIYFGLCLVAVASATYGLRCPIEIKQFATPADYTGSGNNYSVAQLTEIASRTDDND